MSAWTLTAFTNGVAATPGYGSWFDILFSRHDQHTDTWANGDTWNIAIATTAGDYNFGQSEVMGIYPSAMLTLNNRLFLLEGSKWYGSALFDPTQWEVQTPSAFSVTLTGRSSQQENYVAMASYQGRIAIFSPNNVQIWKLDADPDLVVKMQDLAGVGTTFTDSVQSLGDSDVLFLHTSGVRSLQVRDSSLNACVVDIGTPVDTLVQADYASYSASKNFCSAIEPQSGRYWLYMGGRIYVLSYYPSVKITAWSTYAPTYNKTTEGVVTQETFTPVKFVSYAGSLYTLNSDGSVCQYGGTTSTAYCELTLKTPWFDMKTPGDQKYFESLDAIFTGNWVFSASTDPWASTPQTILTTSELPSGEGTGTKSTFDLGRIPMSMRGSKLQLSASTSSATATLSGLFINYNQEGKR